MEDGKISVQEYLADKSLLNVVYIPFDDKLSIVSRILNGLVGATQGLNSSLLRRISTEVFIEALTNIKMNVVNEENGLDGFDQLLFTQELDSLKMMLGAQYEEFEDILDEYVQDYIRTETNPSVTIQAIYDQVLKFANQITEYLTNTLSSVDVEELTSTLAQLAALNGGKTIEGK